MGYNLRRTRDGEGEQGSLSEVIAWNEDRTFKEVVGAIPVVGCSVKVGSPFARSYSTRDWWMTTVVTEILEEIKNDDVHYIRFMTENSEYEWWTGIYPKEIK
jgi:hypothetical protein